MKRRLYLLFLTGLLTVVASLSIGQTPKEGKEKGMEEIREPAVAGTWYPGKSDVLSADVRRYLENAKQEKEKK